MSCVACRWKEGSRGGLSHWERAASARRPRQGWRALMAWPWLCLGRLGLLLGASIYRGHQGGTRELLDMMISAREEGMHVVHGGVHQGGRHGCPKHKCRGDMVQGGQH